MCLREKARNWYGKVEEEEGGGVCEMEWRGGALGSGYTVFSATPARAVVTMATGRAEAKPPSTYPIRVGE